MVFPNIGTLELYYELFNHFELFILQVNFELFFDELFSDTVTDKLPGSQRIIVREPKYYHQLNSALEEDSDFTKEGLGIHSYFLSFISLFFKIRHQLAYIHIHLPSMYIILKSKLHVSEDCNVFCKPRT